MGKKPLTKINYKGEIYYCLKGMEKQFMENLREIEVNGWPESKQEEAKSK